MTIRASFADFVDFVSILFYFISTLLLTVDALSSLNTNHQQHIDAYSSLFSPFFV